MATTPSRSWLVLPLAATIAAVGGGIVAGVTEHHLDLELPLSAACFAVLWVTVGRARTALSNDPQRAFVLALGASGVSLCVGAGVSTYHAEPLWADSFGGYYRCGNSGPPGPAAAVVVLSLGVLLAERLAGWLPRPHPLLARAIVALLATVVVGMSLAGLLQVASRPTTRDRFAGIPVVATLRAPDAARVIETHQVGSKALTVGCVEWEHSTRCYVFLSHGSRAGLQASWPPPQERSEMEGLSFAAPGDTLQVLRDARHDLWIVRSPAPHMEPHAMAAFRGRELQRVNLSLGDFPGDFAPPLGWPIAALLGVAFAAWLARRARFIASMPPGPLSDATLDNEGTLHLANGAVFATPPTTNAVFPVGPVVVVAEALAPGPYRDGAPAAVVRAGTLARWSAALRDERDVRYALAFSTLVLLGTPMFIAASLGLLW